MDDKLIPELMRPTVYIKNAGKVAKMMKTFISKGSNGLQVVADFDRTITKYSHNGKKVQTSHKVLTNCDLVSENYKDLNRKLDEKYYPIEVNKKLTMQEKIPHMIEWWTQGHTLIESSGITKDSLSTMTKNSEIVLRDGSSDLFSSLHKHEVPLLIFSAGIGDVIEELLRQQGELYDNMKIVSNFLNFDSDGKVIGFKGELIHIFNKDESAIHESDYFEMRLSCKNVLLLGDSLGDLTMARGVVDGNILKIGFLNECIDERLQTYMDSYDVVLAGDDTMDIPNAILREIFQL